MDIDLSNLPEEVTVTVYPYVHIKYGFLYLSDCLEPFEDYAQLGPGVDVTFHPESHHDLVNQVTQGLRAEQQKIRAESEAKCVQIEERIQSMLALEGPK